MAICLQERSTLDDSFQIRGRWGTNFHPEGAVVASGQWACVRAQQRYILQDPREPS